MTFEVILYFITRMKTSIRYAKENDRERRERKKGRSRDIEREGDIKERELVYNIITQKMWEL